MTVPELALRPMRWWDIRVIEPIERDVFGADGWTPALFWSELAQLDSRRFLVAHRGREVVGYAGLAAGELEAFVQTLAVRRDEWGRGVGSSLLTGLLEEAGRRACWRVLLEVRVDNPRARTLYERFGFAVIGRRRGYYQPSGIDALVMRRG